MEPFLLVGSFDNLQFERTAWPQGGDPLQEFAGIPSIGPNEPDPRKAVSYPSQKQFGSISILNIGCMHDYSNNQPECIYEQMPFATVDFLAGVIAMEPTFSVVLTDWLSIMAALGSSSRPSAMRTFARNASWSCVQVPSRRHTEK
jgi:hypothetical protein